MKGRDGNEGGREREQREIQIKTAGSEERKGEGTSDKGNGIWKKKRKGASKTTKRTGTVEDTRKT